jgi:uncharacterized damage-inducible protein DinB
MWYMGLLNQMLHYDAWANQALLASAIEDQTVLRLLGHLAQAKQIWLMRVEGRDTSSLELWPTEPLSVWRQFLPEIDRKWISRAAEEEPGRIVAYRNQSGNSWRTSVEEIVIHVVNHGTYHRGQLATAVKNAGGEPAVTDFIVWSRANRPRVQ